MEMLVTTNLQLDQVDGLTEIDKRTIVSQYDFGIETFDPRVRARVLNQLGRFTSYLQARRLSGDHREPLAIKNEWLRIGR